MVLCSAHAQDSMTVQTAGCSTRGGLRVARGRSLNVLYAANGPVVAVGEEVAVARPVANRTKRQRRADPTWFDCTVDQVGLPCCDGMGPRVPGIIVQNKHRPTRQYHRHFRYWC